MTEDWFCVMQKLGEALVSSQQNVGVDVYFPPLLQVCYISDFWR